MDAVHLGFGSTLLLVLAMNLLTLPGSKTASAYGPRAESEPATRVKIIADPVLLNRPLERPSTDQQSEPSTTTAASATHVTGSPLKRVIGKVIPNRRIDDKPRQTTSVATTTTTTTTTTTKTTAAPKQIASQPSESDGTQAKDAEEGGSATVPPFMEQCYLLKNESGIIKIVIKDEVGDDPAYSDYEEFCNGDDISIKISAGALAALAG